MRRLWIVSAVILVLLTAVILRQASHGLALQAHVQQSLTPAREIHLYNKVLLGTTTCGAYAGAAPEVAAVAAPAQALRQAQRLTRAATGACVAVGLLLPGSALISSRRRPAAQPWRIVRVQALGLSALLWLLGISTPLVPMTVTGRVPGLGSALIQSTSRGVLAAIADLWSTQPGLALLVAVFSLALPISTPGLAGWALPPLRVIRPLPWVGTWAMADVLVVAVLIVLLSPLRQGHIIQTQARAGVGLTFFAASCVLSMLATLMRRIGAAQLSAPGPAPRLFGAGDDT